MSDGQLQGVAEGGVLHGPSHLLLVVPTAGHLRRTQPPMGVPPLSPVHCERSWGPSLPLRSLVQHGGHGLN